MLSARAVSLELNDKNMRMPPLRNAEHTGTSLSNFPKWQTPHVPVAGRSGRVRSTNCRDELGGSAPIRVAGALCICCSVEPKNSMPENPEKPGTLCRTLRSGLYAQ